MALIFADSTCAICGERLDRPFTATSGCAFPEGHPLWRYCDAPLHLDCLERWPHRERFSRRYFDLAVGEHGAGYGHILAGGESWVLVCGPHTKNKTPYFAAVRLPDWPLRLYSRWERWPDFINGGYKEGLGGAALAAAERAMAEVSAVAPDVPALLRLLHAAT